MAEGMGHFVINEDLRVDLALQGDGRGGYFIAEMRVWSIDEDDRRDGDWYSLFVRKNVRKNSHFRVFQRRVCSYDLFHPVKGMCSLTLSPRRIGGDDKFVVSIHHGVRTGSIELACTRNTTGLAILRDAQSSK